MRTDGRRPTGALRTRPSRAAPAARRRCRRPRAARSWRVRVVRWIRDRSEVGLCEQVTTEARTPHRERSRAHAGCCPGRDFARRRAPGPQSDHGLQCRHKIRVVGEEDADVELTASSHHHEVHGERDVDSLLLSGPCRPVRRIAQVARDDGHKAGATLRLRPRLPPERGVGAWIKPPAWSTAICADACEAAARDSGRQQTTQREQIHLTFASRGVSGTEGLTSTVIDVLIVDEEDYSPGRPGSHDGVREWSKESPAGAALPGRRGGLTRVYRSRVREQRRCGGTRVTVRATDGDWQRRPRVRVEVTAGMDEACDARAAATSVTMASRGGRCGVKAPEKSSVETSPGSLASMRAAHSWASDYAPT